MTTIRDFIYLDIERLYSWYSQAFEGVADHIIQSYIDSLQSSDTSRKGPFLQETDMETKVVEVSRRTENKFLYDHMYNQLEERITSAITEVSGISRGDYYEIVSEGFAVKAIGTAEIEDFKWVKELTEKYNEMGAAMHYITTFNAQQARETEKSIDELKRRVDVAKDKNERVRAERMLETTLNNIEITLKDAALARKLGFDDRYLQHLCYLMDMFYPDRFDVTVVPKDATGDIAFRGVLDKKWLRVQPNFLRSLYSGKALNWTIVGQVTRFPEKTSEITAPSESAETESRSIRDAFQDMIRQGNVIEKTFTVSNRRVEIIITPVAIYRESVLPRLKSM